MRKTIVAALLATLGVLAASGASAEPITLYANVGQPPKAWLDNGTPRGYAVEAAQDVLKRAGYEVTVSLLPYARALEMTKKGDVMTGVFFTAERAQSFAFSKPLVYEDVIMVVAKGKEFAFMSASDLTGKRVGVQEKYFYGDDFAAAAPRIAVDGDTSASARLKTLAAGRLDVAFLSPGRAAFDDTVAESGLPPGAFTVLPKPLQRFADHMVVGKDAPGAGRLSPV
jgi:ABC-type amino acid transport substrate-binding protein